MGKERTNHFYNTITHSNIIHVCNTTATTTSVFPRIQDDKSNLELDQHFLTWYFRKMRKKSLLCITHNKL